MNSTLPYRPGVGIMLLNRDNLVFVAKRIDMVSEAWQMPQGGIDEGEDPEDCALRELEEETGISPKYVSILAESDGWIDYDLPDELIPKVWGGRFCGQRQKWYAMRLESNDSCINIETKEPEFSEWRWTEIHNLPDIIVPFKRDMYQNLVDIFSVKLGL